MLSSFIACVALGTPGALNATIQDSVPRFPRLERAGFAPGRIMPQVQTASSQVDLGVAQAVALGLERSPKVAAMRERVRAAQGGLASARALEPPQVTLGPTIGGESATPILTQKFEISGRRRARTKVAEQELLVAESALATTELDVIRDIRLAYADLNGAQSVVSASLDVQGLIRRIRDSVKKQVEVGQVPVQELVKAEVELSRSEIETLRAHGVLDRARYALNEMLARPSDAPLRATDPVTIAPLVASLDTVSSEALSARPEIASGEAAIAAAVANTGLQRSDLRPDLDFSLLANTDLKSRDFLRPRALGLGLTLAFPLFDTGRIRGRVDQAESEAKALESDLAATKLRVSQEVADAYSRVQNAENLAQRYQREVLSGAKEILDKAEFGYGRGALTLLDFLEAQRTHKAAQLDYLDALTQYAKARAQLERAVGRGLPGKSQEAAGKPVSKPGGKP